MARSVAVALVAQLIGCIVPDTLPSSLSAADRATVYEAVEVHVRAIQLYEQGNPSDAIAVAEKSRLMLESALGATHPCVAVPLHSLAVFHQTQGDYVAAAALYQRVVSIQEKVLSATDIGLVPSLDELAELYIQWGAYDKAEPVAVRALAIRDRELGPADAGVVEGIARLARVYARQGVYDKAEALYLRALALTEKLRGPKHADTARVLDGLAMVYWNEGTYARAEPLLVRALSIRQTLFSEISQFGPEGIERVALNFRAPDSTSPRPLRVGETVESRVYMSLTLGAYTTFISAAGADALRKLSNLDRLVSVTAANAKAEPLRVATTDAFDTVLATAHAELAESRDNLARLYVSTGDYQRAEPLFIQSKEDREKTLAANHPDLANSLNDLAQLYQTQGAYAKAEPLLLQVLRIREKALGLNHPDVARSLNNLALLYRMQGASRKAEPLLVRTTEILERKLGPTHPDVARSLNNLALVYHDQGDYAKAEPLYRRAIAIASSSPGVDPDVARYLDSLGVLYQARGEPEQAEPLMARAADLRDARLDVDLPRLSAPRKRSLMTLLQQETDSLVSLHADSTPHSDRAFELALTTVLRRKGLALESLLDNHAALRAHLTPDRRLQLDRLTAASTELSTLLHSPPALATKATRASAIAAARARVDALESELSAASAVDRARSQPVTAARIQAALPLGTALIEFVRYRRFDARADRERWRESRYVAYVLQRDQPPQWIALGPAAVIDDAVDAVLAQMHPGADPESTRAALRGLDGLVFAPIRDRLPDVPHLIISPDSKLNLVPFDALLDGDGRFELEHRVISYATSGRDLLRRAARSSRSPVTIVAAPDYGAGTRFTPLAGARAEGADVAAFFPRATVLTGSHASKAMLARASGPMVLHIATHGFFARRAAAPSARALPPASGALLDSAARDLFVDDALVTSSAPSLADPSEALDRAGLALAGANVGANGIVTAREIANYDWWGTRLVVLSACETGIGAVPTGDGVYGLRRALAQAGTESRIVSLWSVNDSSVRALMHEFYSELARGTGRAEALRRAKRWTLQQPAFAHPYYWAAFIADGEWAPLGDIAMRKPASP